MVIQLINGMVHPVEKVPKKKRNRADWLWTSLTQIGFVWLWKQGTTQGWNSASCLHQLAPQKITWLLDTGKMILCKLHRYMKIHWIMTYIWGNQLFWINFQINTYKYFQAKLSNCWPDKYESIRCPTSSIIKGFRIRSIVSIDF